MSTDQRRYAVLERGPTIFEVWAPCAAPSHPCGVHHRQIATCSDKGDALKIARALDDKEMTP